MVSSTSTSNVGLKVCTTWVLMGQAQIPTIYHQNLDHNITHPAAIHPMDQITYLAYSIAHTLYSQTHLAVKSRLERRAGSLASSACCVPSDAAAASNLRCRRRGATVARSSGRGWHLPLRRGGGSVGELGLPLLRRGSSSRDLRLPRRCRQGAPPLHAPDGEYDTGAADDEPDEEE